MSLPRASPTPDPDADAGGDAPEEGEAGPADPLAEQTEGPDFPVPSPWRRRLAVAGALAAAAVAGMAIPLPYRVTDDCQLEAWRRAHLRFAVAGRVQEVLVREGDQVQEGQPVARLYAGELQNELERARARLKKVDAELAQLERGARQEELEQARLAASRKAAEVEFAARELDRWRTAAEGGAGSREEAERAASELEVKQREHEEALAMWRLLRAGNRPETVAAKRAEQEQARGEVQLLERKLQDTELRAPLSGVIATPSLDQRAGEQMQIGQDFAEVLDRSKLQVEVMVDEAQIDLVAPGQPVRVRLRSRPDLEVQGTVEHIAPRVEEQRVEGLARGKRFVRVRATLPNPQDVLRPGMQGSAQIEIGRMTLAGQVKRGAERMLRVSLFF
ncbi:MAG TPA: efflux RND transporter periplasmic adaptor subunit [Myxococcales bacterium]|nr:efflux RND transporter periplasmic adaptor subunit [Myxococcales bacterium]